MANAATLEMQLHISDVRGQKSAYVEKIPAASTVAELVQDLLPQMHLFDNDSTGVVFGNRASGGRVLRSERHGVGIGCYMKIPDEIEILEDNQRRVLGGWEVDGVDEKDVPRYEGTLTMHEHFVDCVVNGKTPLTDLRDVIHSIDLVDRIEGPLD